MKDQKRLRRHFLHELRRGLSIVWPIVSALIVVMVLLGFVVSHLESWPLMDGLYFSFVTGLTIGYGDLVPKTTLGRLCALSIGVLGIVLTGFVVSVAVQALRSSLDGEDGA